MLDLERCIRWVFFLGFISFTFGFSFAHSQLTPVITITTQPQLKASVLTLPPTRALTHTLVNTQTRSPTTTRISVHVTLHPKYPNQPPQVQPLSFNPEPNAHPFLPSQTLYLNQAAISSSQPMRHPTYPYLYPER